MTRANGGVWVSFGIHVRSATKSEFPPGMRIGGPAPDPIIRVKVELFEHNCKDDVPLQLDVLGESLGTLVGRYFVTVEVGPAPPSRLESRPMDIIRRKLVRALRDNASAIREEARKRLTMFPSPSSPGQPPGFDTGALAESIEIFVDDRALEAAIGSRRPYAKWLECGTTFMAERPFLFNSLVARIERLRSDVEAEVLRQFSVNTGMGIPTDRMGFPKLTGDREIDSAIIWFTTLAGRNFANVPTISPADQATKEGLKEKLIRALDNLLRALEHAAGPPDPPFPPPSGPGGMPVPGRLPKRF